LVDDENFKDSQTILSLDVESGTSKIFTFFSIVGILCLMF
jgi:hypothetical protein